ncbi:MAG TPA: HAD hydrolase-like protein [Candidatus Dormibacteraeota bacterium]|nr:HAD hydrolase-like protein [Candidatus Dormibacteraeota bacterium]
MSAIIFDMDGTIADSFDYVSDFLVKQAKLPPLNDEQKRSLRGLSMRDMAHRLGYHWWDAPRLFIRGRQRMKQSIKSKNLQSFSGMPEIIRKLHNEGHELFILTTNSLPNVHHFLDDQKIHKYFLEIYAGVGVFSKAPGLRQLLKQQHLRPEEAIYVCDELRDIEAAQAVGVRTVAVTWGFARRGKLVAIRPTALADTPDELMRILEEV